MLSAIRPECCDGVQRWCIVCGGREFGPLLGIAHCSGALWGERVYEALRNRPLPSEFPGRLDEEFFRLHAPHQPRLRQWLAEEQLREAQRWWRLLLKRHC